MKRIDVRGLLLMACDESLEIRAGLRFDFLANENGARLAAAALDFEGGADHGAWF
jgi:hypothetical protein